MPGVPISEIVMSIIFGVVTATSIWLWLKYMRVSLVQRGTYLLDRSVKARWGLIDVLVICFVWLASQALTLVTLYSINDLDSNSILDFPTKARFSLIIGLVQMVVVIASLVYIMSRYRIAEWEFGFEKNQIRKGLFYGLVGFVMWIPIVWIVHSILTYFIDYSHESLSVLKSNPETKVVIDVWISAVLIAPVVEEILFRGIIQGWLQRCKKGAMSESQFLINGGPMPPADEKPKKKQSKQPIHWNAIIITSLMFGLIHYGQGPAPITIFVLSLGLGYLYQRTGSLIACIAMHMILNGITMLVSTIAIATG